MNSICNVDMFTSIGKANALCITTNGYVTGAGKCVMGRGCAKQALDRWKGIDKILADQIDRYGNRVNIIGEELDTIILSFPVKPVSIIFDGSNCVSHMANRFSIGQSVPGWAATASNSIIHQSCLELVELTNAYGWKQVVVPAPGCGAGELDYSQVEQYLRDIFDDRFWIVRR